MQSCCKNQSQGECLDSISLLHSYYNYFVTQTEVCGKTEIGLTLKILHLLKPLQDNAQAPG